MRHLAMHFLVSLAAAAGGEFTAKVEGQPVEVHFAAEGFEADASLVRGRTIAGGGLQGGAMLTVLCEDNLPFLSGADCRERKKGESGFEAFAVGDVAACKLKSSLREGVTMTDYYAWPTTPDHLFILHASVTQTKSAKVRFDKNDFEKLVASFRVTGAADRSGLMFPSEVYAFRDEAARHADEQLAWVTKECAARPDDFAAHGYLGMLGLQHDDQDLVRQGYGRCAEILWALAERSPKHDQLLFQALDRESGAYFARKKYREALAVCQRLGEASAKSTHEKAQAFLAQAHYNSAICHAQTGQAGPAIESLKKAIEVRPEFKDRAAQDELLKSLRTKKEFKALVGA